MQLFFYPDRNCKMKKFTCISIFFYFHLLYCNSIKEKTGSTVVFSHNDYVQAIPFTNAYNHGIGYIEVDVYLRHDSLLVAHEINEINTEKTLQKLYLDPLSEKIKKNNGTVFPDADKSLVLMIDLKTDGEQTIPILIQILISYPNLITSKSNLKIVLSGSMPSPGTWDQYPDYIWFDGRPTIAYDRNALMRVAFVSTNFKNYSNWNGLDSISEDDDRKIMSLIQQVHVLKKSLRFWATPDTENAWAYLVKRKVDILGTDRVSELCQWLNSNK